jgi:hypothetical protein
MLDIEGGKPIAIKHVSGVKTVVINCLLRNIF